METVQIQQNSDEAEGKNRFLESEDTKFTAWHSAGNKSQLHWLCRAEEEHRANSINIPEAWPLFFLTISTGRREGIGVCPGNRGLQQEQYGLQTAVIKWQTTRQS